MFRLVQHVGHVLPRSLFESGTVQRAVTPLTDWLYSSLAVQLDGGIHYNADSRTLWMDTDDDFEAGRAAGMAQSAVAFSTVLPFLGLYLLSQVVSDWGYVWATAALAVLLISAVVVMGVVYDCANVAFEHGRA